ncbi:MAG: hypothetical protein DRO89_04040 [Candidatus Altiarchaeales archaeon]|nr:MAG: hypothetical protein DRO89_04040 [Candidatus Altiarchaeales archaeon]
MYLYKDFQLTYVGWRREVRDIMSGSIVKIDAESSVDEANRKMVDEGVTSLTVENSGDTVLY